MKRPVGKTVLTYGYIAFCGMLCALSLRLFVFPNNFASAGIGGITTMLQYLFDISIGYMTMLINIPLAIAVYFLISKPLAVRAMVYTMCFSLFSILFRDILDLSSQEYVNDVLGPMVGGILSGTVNGLLSKVGATQAGVYFISSLIRYKKPHLNLSWLSFALNAVVAAVSFFVYGMELRPVLLCVIYCFAASMVNDMIVKSGRKAVRFEIVTEEPEALCDAIIHQLHHSATLMPAKGIYQGKETNVLVCVVNTTQATTLSRIIAQQPNAFAIVSQVNQVVGNFKRLDVNNEPERQLLDHGEIKKVY